MAGQTPGHEILKTLITPHRDHIVIKFAILMKS